MEGLNRYYKLKSNYERKYREKKRDIMKNPDLSLRDKEGKIKQLRKSRVCMQCQNNGGNIFKNALGHLTVTCGSVDPCDIDKKYNVENLNHQENLRDIQEVQSLDLKSLRKSVIITKLDFLFGYATEEKTISQFDLLKTDIKSVSKQLMNTKVSYASVSHDKARYEEKEEMDKLANILIQEIKEDGNIVIKKKLDDLIKVMVEKNCKLQKHMDEYRNLKLKYMVNDVIINDSDLHHVSLIQKPLDYDSMYVVATPTIENTSPMSSSFSSSPPSSSSSSSSSSSESFSSSSDSSSESLSFSSTSGATALALGALRL